MTLDQQISSNRRRTWLVFALFGLVFGLLALAMYFYTESVGLLSVVGVIIVVYGVYSYYASGRIISSMTGAKPVSREDYPELYHVIDEIAISAGLATTPPLYVIHDDAPNAFAAGRNPENAYVAVTTGLIETMDARQVRGVIAHEVAHIVSRDVRLMSVAVVMVGVIAILSDIMLRVAFFGGKGAKRDGAGMLGLALMIVGSILAPLAAVMIQMAVSRQREFLADMRGADFSGDPEGLALALKSLQADTRAIRNQRHATAHLYIESPMDKEGFKLGFKGLFNTHPPLEERIARLEDAGGL